MGRLPNAQLEARWNGQEEEEEEEEAEEEALGVSTWRWEDPPVWLCIQSLGSEAQDVEPTSYEVEVL